MRVGIYDPYLDDVGGGEKYMMTIAQILSKDNNVSVFWDDKNDLAQVKNRFSLDLSNVTLTKNIFSSKTSFARRFKESQRFDAIIILSDGSVPLVNSKLYMHVQRPLEHVHLSPIGRLKMKRVSSVFCNSEFTKSYIDKTFNIRSRVIYPPVTFSDKTSKKENIILHVGRFRVFDRTVGAGDFKKQHVMLKVFKEMIDAGLTKWKLVMAVSVQEEDNLAFEEMKRAAEGYPIEFEINKSNASLWDFYAKAKIYWHASGYGEDLKKNPELAEHFGISTVEAMGAGAVPVVIAAGGQKEIVTDGENGFTWTSLEEFKDKTITLTKSPALLSKMSKKAKVRSQDFTLSAFEEKIKTMLS